MTTATGMKRDFSIFTAKELLPEVENKGLNFHFIVMDTHYVIKACLIIYST